MNEYQQSLIILSSSGKECTVEQYHVRGRLHRVYACRSRCCGFEEAWNTSQIGPMILKALLANTRLGVTFDALAAFMGLSHYIVDYNNHLSKMWLGSVHKNVPRKPGCSTRFKPLHAHMSRIESTNNCFHCVEISTCRLQTELHHRRMHNAM